MSLQVFRPFSSFAVVFIIAFALAACSKSGGPEATIKSARAGDMTVTLAGPGGELRSGETELMVSFVDDSGTNVDVGAASLTFHMPAMGSMAEMNDKAKLTTTEVPGKYRALVNIQMPGTWEARVAYEGPRGSGQALMTVNVK
jgi:hypothetical protein